jgi:ubiquinone/menaquinone biosynthesis C-methylase UbiE
MRRADYSKIAAGYDRSRRLTDRNLDLWIEVISQHSPSLDGARLLDLGCGTGRFTLPLAARLGCRLVGADSSMEMLKVATRKDEHAAVAWVNCRAESLPFAPQSFNIIFMSHLLHHVDSPRRVLAQCFRSLSSGGVLLNRYGALAQIRGDVEHTFFPETVALDEVRTPSAATVEAWLRGAGFSEVGSREIVQQTYRHPQERVEAIRGKATSVMSLISPAAQAEGLKRLSAYIDENPGDPWLLQDHLTLTVGGKER